MTISPAKGAAFAIPFPVPRIFSSIAVLIGGLALFLVVASLLLVSRSTYSSFHGDSTDDSKSIELSSDAVEEVRGSDGSVSLDGSEAIEIVGPVLSGPHNESRIEPSSGIEMLNGSRSGTLSSSSETEEVGDADEAVPLLSGSQNGSGVINTGSNAGDTGSSAPANQSEKIDSKICDLYHGKWIHDLTGPLYTNNTCRFITQMQNCQGNGRPDKDYENWRWKPDQCDLPRFDVRRFLELMRGKTLAFIGDSVARNQMESMLCILSQVEAPKKKGNRRMQRWYFRSTSTTLVRIWSSWLVHQTSEPLHFAPEGVIKVHLDLPDESFMQSLPNFDVVVISSGHWFIKQTAYVLNGTIVGGQLWWPKEAGEMQVNNFEAFRISVETALTAIASHPNFTGLAIVRTYSPDHYEGGAWNTGGSCTGKVRAADKVVPNGFTDVMHEKQVAGFEQAAQKAGSGFKLKLMDITEVFGYRVDGHPGPYRNPDPTKLTKRGPNGELPPQDCLHWCMPGPIDTWNEILLETIQREFERV